VSTALACSMYYLAERSLRSWGACTEVVDLYRVAATALAAAGQSYLATVATERAGAVESLL
jgi:hypothetical protein